MVRLGITPNGEMDMDDLDTIFDSEIEDMLGELVARGFDAVTQEMVDHVADLQMVGKDEIKITFWSHVSEEARRRVMTFMMAMEEVGCDVAGGIRATMAH